MVIPSQIHITFRLDLVSRVTKGRKKLISFVGYFSYPLQYLVGHLAGRKSRGAFFIFSFNRVRDFEFQSLVFV